MRYTLILRRVAQREFDEAADWYRAHRAGLGAEFIDAVEQVFENLGNNPELYAVVHEEIRQAFVRRFPYALYYRIEGRRVIILAISHTSRDPAVWQSRS
jgi:plasmid stabilization system protein ParE